MFSLLAFIIKLFIALAMGAFLQYSPFRKNSEKFMLKTAYVGVVSGGAFASVTYLDADIRGMAFLAFSLLIGYMVSRLEGDLTVYLSVMILGMLVGAGALLPAIPLAIVLYIMINVLNALNDKPRNDEIFDDENME
jgi:Fe2+ transport system protein B